MVQQWNLDIERQLPRGTILTVGYAGARDSHQQTASWNMNTAPPNLEGVDPVNLRPYPNLDEIIAFLDRGLSRYDSLQAKAEMKTNRGFYYLVSYTYSKAFDNGLNDNLGSLVGIPYYPLAPGRADKGLSADNETNNFAASALYVLPFGNGYHIGASANGIVQQLISRWQLNAISHMGSGFPLGLATGINNSGTNLVSAGSSIGGRPTRSVAIQDSVTVRSTSSLTLAALPIPLLGSWAMLRVRRSLDRISSTSMDHYSRHLPSPGKGN